MGKLKEKNLFIEINDDNFLVAVGKHDDELNFEIIERETFSPSGFKKGKVVDLDASTTNLKKTINKIENKLNLLFSEVNLIVDQSDIDCINVNGFKKLNGNQILSQDISYILNDIKSKLVDAEKNKKIIHLFNTNYLLDNKKLKNLPIGLYGDFYSHQLTFFLMNDNELKNIKTLLNKCNLNVNKIILKSFTEGVKIIHKDRKDTFIKIKIGKNETNLSCFYNSAFCFFQKFNFGSEIILKDISKVCSLELAKVQNIILGTDFKISDKNMYVDKKYFDEKNFRKISLKHIIEICSARIEEMINITFNQNKNLKLFKEKETLLYLDIEDKNVFYKFKDIFGSQFSKCNLIFCNSVDEDNFSSIKIFGELLIKGWTREAIPIVNKKKSWISRIFSGLFD